MTDPAFTGVVPPDAGAVAAARARQNRLTKPPGALGRLEELSIWVAGCQGVCPPHQFTRPRVVVFAGDHGVASAGVSAYPAEVTAQMVANIVSGGAAINVSTPCGAVETRSAVPAAPQSASNSAASCSMIVPPSCSASMIVTARW